MHDFLIFLLVGFLAQSVDGALGMAYGVISSTVLLAFGVPPATASAAVHAAEVFTTAASAGSHTVNKNVNWKLFAPLVAGGVVGGVLGAFVLTSIDGDILKPWITVYLSIMGLVIIWRATKKTRERAFPIKFSGPLGLVGGFFDAIGGGGWGPTVTTTMVGSGQDPRISIGTTNTAEFFVTAAISATFLTALLTGHWDQAEGITSHASSIAGLILGGLIAAPFAGIIARIAPRQVLTYGVGAVVLLSAGYQALRLFGVL
ncbi:sulfite exporter TauE/SafE family protein [Brevundimonas sp.]|uniref:sulfite exporter TauE/SafE family protein n=1 Tax=Brevundimonas sp. TaxID=1871086 RepID=UPI003BAB9A2B